VISSGLMFIANLSYPSVSQWERFVFFMPP
jgi:hypothetical protein